MSETNEHGKTYEEFASKMRTPFWICPQPTVLSQWIYQPAVVFQVILYITMGNMGPGVVAAPPAGGKVAFSRLRHIWRLLFIYYEDSISYVGNDFET